MRELDAGSLEPFAGTVIYTGVRGTTPTKRIAMLSDALQSQPGDLVYEVLGQDAQGRSFDVLMDCAKARSWAAEVEAGLRSSLIGRLFPKRIAGTDTLGSIVVESVLSQMSLRQRLFPPANLGEDLLAETILVGALSASKSDEPELDARVVSYNEYQTKHRIALPKECISAPHLAASEKAFGFAKVGRDVLIACGAAWDVRYAAELMPTNPLQRHIGHLTNALPFIGDRHENMPELVSLLPNTVAHHSAQSLVRGTHEEVGYKEAALGVNYQTLRDLHAYERILIDHVWPINPKVSLTEGLKVLDNLRPHLRRVGIFDADTMEQHAGIVATSVVRIHSSPETSRASVFAHCAKSVARSVFAPPVPASISAGQIAQQARQQTLDKRNTHVVPLDEVEAPIREFIAAERWDGSYSALLPHKRALDDVEFLRANGVTEVSVIVEKSDALGDELAWKILEMAEDLRMQEKANARDAADEVIVAKDNAASRGYVDPPAPTRPSSGRER